MNLLPALRRWLAPRRPAASAPAAGTGTAPPVVTLRYDTPVLPEAEERRILAEVAPHTMVHETGVAFYMNETVRLVRNGVPGAVVECGVWRGGASLACLLAQRSAFGRVERPVWLLDSFEGLPPVTEKDGPLARTWQTGEDAERFLDNCRAAEEEAHALMRRHGLSAQEAVITKGWFRDTLPAVTQAVAGQGIAMLRLDGDWYDSTLECLEALEPLVAEEGIVIVDDYYAWDGCARAVHDYLSRHDLPYRLKSLPYNFGMYFVKRANRGSYEQF